MRTEEEQQAAAREREERERAELEKEINDRREARRKSLANRRVSFAAEATLHTFHEIEEMHDSTTSTDSTRRASSYAASSPASHHNQPSSDPPSTPPDHTQDHVDEFPANQRDLHQRNRRRSSGAASLYSEDDTMASSTYDSDLEHADSIAEIQHEEVSGSSGDSSEDGSVVTVEAEEMTSASIASMASARSDFTSGSTGSLDENLRLAARMAATQSIDDEEEVIAGFAGWGRKNRSQESISQPVNNQGTPNETNENVEDQGSDMEMDDTNMDMTNVVGDILRPQPASPEKDDDGDEDMSMDVTTALGGILSKAKAFLRRKSVNPTSQSEPEEFGEQTMDLTTAVGGIHQGQDEQFDDTQAEIDDNEDMSMEFTAVMGKLLPGSFPKSGSQDNRRQTMIDIDDDDDDAMMDMTMGVGQILPTEMEQEEDIDQTMGMDMTVPMGGIIKPASAFEARTAARKIMEQEADEPIPSVTTTPNPAGSPKRLDTAMIGDNASSELAAFQGKGLRRSLPRAASPVARSPAQPSSSPMRRTPSPKRNTAQSQRSPTRTPPSRASSAPSSPMRIISSPIKTTPRSPSRKSLFHQNPTTGLNTPRIVLTPQGRRLSGVGADRPGLGSPRVAEIFDRRESIGEAATDFVPSQPANPRRTVAFTDPRVIEAEVDKERWEEQEKEDSRRILEREVNGSPDDRDTATNLMEMIQGLSPKKNPLRGRKSLHVGSALGLLGKRPVELDEDEESEEVMDGVKRLKGRQGSPVKNIRLNSPPSKAETTTGRKTRPSINPSTAGDRATPIVASSPQRATTPRSQGRFRNVGDDQPTNTVDFAHSGLMEEVDMQQEDDGERIHLQDFLNMTSIRFMELTTTKRRHTVAPGEGRSSTAANGDDDISLERCVVAGACTVPMLELYQHVSKAMPDENGMPLTKHSHAANSRNTSRKAAASSGRLRPRRLRRTRRSSEST